MDTKSNEKNKTKDQKVEEKKQPTRQDYVDQGYFYVLLSDDELYW